MIEYRNDALLSDIGSNFHQTLKNLYNYVFSAKSYMHSSRLPISHLAETASLNTLPTILFFIPRPFLLSLRRGTGNLLGLAHHVVHLGLLSDHLGQHRGSSLGIVDHRVVGEILPLDETALCMMCVYEV